jgi:predicted amidophosphoribosyltransferase
MHRTERWLNVNDSFFVKNPSILENKKILLIDDVVTTGATMEACGREILNVKNTQLSIATIAIATK